MFHYFHIIHAFLLLSSSSLLLCSARDMITMSQVIRDGETIVSKGEKFKLGFFTPDGAKPDKRYVGIWYHGLSQNSTTVVWVANKENPLPNSKGYITIGEGNLKVLDERENIFWITKVSSSVTTISAKLLDSGNLILTGEGKDDDPIWQSFLNDYNTFLPGMTMDTSKVLQSWANEHDPAPGSFIFKLDISQRTRHIVKRGPETYWRSQSSDDFTNSKAIPNSVAILLSNFNSTTKKDNITPPFPQDFNNTRLIMHSTGQIRFYNWSDLLWFEPSNNCSLYNACGTYGICNSSTSNLVCECLKGFKPKSQRDWDSGEFSEGCTTLSRGCTADDFLSLKVIKVVNPDDTNFDNAKNMEECRRACLHECKCNAFSFEAKVREGMGNTACHLWLDHDLKDLEEDTSKKGQEIWVRVPRSNMGVPEISHSSPSKKSSSLMIVITIATVVTVFSGAIICIFGWRIILTRRMPDKRNAYRESTQESLTFDGYDENARDLIDPNKFGKDEDIDVPLFSFESIVAATKDFSKTNKLGQGGFGPVYKGKLLGGQEIAVKRLSRSSGQGLVEFKNEVILIAKLQHRNLVKLLGYSTKGHEKILVYEYMPNKSLDSFIFDQSRCSLLNWEKRFNIIMGIARGLLYLHQDSRLTIIHRDLKTSNILLDEEMNPKISDFGLARIFGGNQTAANTNRVAGTYGYMSPEYALDGIFSTKSDVFSFGVVLLEIISGKKNTDFQSEHSLNLIGYAWELWKEDKVLDFMDKSLSESYNASEVSKCINVGLLCVQDDVDDRPTMENIIFRLGSETTTLPTPKEPAFVARKYCPSSRPEMYSYNELSITEEQGR